MAAASARVGELAGDLVGPDPVRGAVAERELRALAVERGDGTLVVALTELLGRDHWASVPRVARLLGSRGDDIAALIRALEFGSEDVRQGAAMAIRYHHGESLADQLAALLGETPTPQHAIRAMGNCGEVAAAALLTGQTSWRAVSLESTIAEALETLLLSQDSDTDAREVGNAVSAYSARHGMPFAVPPVTYVHRLGRGWIDLAIELLDELADEGVADVLAERAILWLGLARVARGVAALGHVAGSEKVATNDRAAAVNALADSGRDGALGYVARAAGVRVADDDPGFGAMQSAIDLATARLCGQGPEPIELARPVLQRAEAAGNVRAAGEALRSIGRHGADIDDSVLSSHLTSSDATLRVSAAAGLASLRGPAALGTIREVEREASTDLERVHLLAAMARVDPPSADLLQERLCSLRPGDRALWMLERPFRDTIVEAFQEAPDRQVAWQAVLHHPEVPALDELWKDLDASPPAARRSPAAQPAGRADLVEPSPPDAPASGVPPRDGAADSNAPDDSVESGTAADDAPAVDAPFDDGPATNATPPADASQAAPKSARGSGHGTRGRPHSQADEPSPEDQLGRKNLVDILTAMLDEPAQGTPFTIALFGAWGAGKSSMLRQLHGRLGAKVAKHDWKVATFNAWRYEKTDSLAAGLVQEAVRAIVPTGWWSRFAFRWSYAWRTNRERLLWSLFVLAASLAAAIFGLFTGATDDSIARIFLGLGGVSVFTIVATTLIKLYQHPVSVELMTYFRLPTYGQHLGVLETMKRQLETVWSIARRKPKGGRNIRLLVVVDDLDRCSTKAIAATFDAVRLVMDLEGVVVVIALDERIGLGAIAIEYDELARDGRSAPDVARDFLAKIVQLPLRLPPPVGVERFVRESLFADVATPNGARTPTAERGPAVAEPSAHAGTRPSANLEGDSTGQGARAVGGDNQSTVVSGAGDAAQGVGFSTPTQSPDGSYTAEAADESVRDLLAVTMKEDPDEITRFLSLAEQCGLSNPRQLRRLRNCYRFTKAATPTTLDWDLLMTMLFWQEVLHTLPIDEHRRHLEHVAKNGTKGGAAPPALVAEVSQLLGDPADYVAYRDAVLVTVLPRLELTDAVTPPAKPGQPSKGRAARA